MGSRVWLKYGHVVECTGCTKDAAGRVVEVQAALLPDTKSGTPGADAVKVKGTIGWVGAHDAVAAEVRLYAPLFLDEQPDAGGKDFKVSLNTESKRVVMGFVDAATAGVAPDERMQFKRHGYFVVDRVDHAAERAVFNRIAGLRDGGGSGQLRIPRTATAVFPGNSTLGIWVRSDTGRAAVLQYNQMEKFMSKQKQMTREAAKRIIVATAGKNDGKIPPNSVATRVDRIVQQRTVPVFQPKTSKS